MPAAVPLAVRHALVAAAPGTSAAALARRFGLAPRTVRRLRAAARSAGAVPPPAYRRGPRPDHEQHPLRAEVLALRQQHPGWGAGLLRIVLGQHHPEADLPCAQTIRRWLAAAGLAPAPAGRRPSDYHRAESVHAVWQLDAADQLPLADGRLVSWLRAVDECSGAVLGTAVFPLGL